MVDIARVNLYGQPIGTFRWDNNRQLAHFEYAESFIGKGLEPSPILMPVRQGRIYSFSDIGRVTFKGLPEMFISSDVADNGGGIGASDNVLAAALEPYQKAMASASVIAEIGSDHYVAEIAPVAEQSATAAESQSARRGIARVDRRNLAV